MTDTLPYPGQIARRSMTLTAAHVRAYAEMTGDYNPLHFDETFALGTRFGRLVVQGGLTTGLLHALVAMDLPGPGSVFLSQNWKFTAPVYIGDHITAEAEVLSVHPSKPVTHLRMTVRRSGGEDAAAGAGSDEAGGELVLEGEAWCYTMRPGE
jgi:acyl dehydratase